MCAKFTIIMASFFVLTTSCRKVPLATDQNGKFPTVSRDVKAVLDGGNELASGEVTNQPEKEFIFRPNEEQCKKILKDIYERGKQVCLASPKDKADIIKKHRFDFAQAALCPDPDEKDPRDLPDWQRQEIEGYALTGKPRHITQTIIRHINAKSWFCKK